MITRSWRHITLFIKVIARRLLAPACSCGRGQHCLPYVTYFPLVTRGEEAFKGAKVRFESFEDKVLVYNFLIFEILGALEV